MRTLRVAICACLVGVLASALHAQADQKLPSDLTVILDFKGPWSQKSVKEMEREAARILKSSGFHLGWTLMGADPYATYDDLAVMTFHGFCGFEPAPPRTYEPGSYAFTHVTDGHVQPFAEVDCDSVVNGVRDAMAGHGYARGDQLVGRALGRVVAHELVHMLSRSTQHASEGVEKPALTCKQLIETTLSLSALDVDRLRQARGAH